jgi:hypothetical protein
MMAQTDYATLGLDYWPRSRQNTLPANPPDRDKETKEEKTSGSKRAMIKE